MRIADKFFLYKRKLNAWLSKAMKSSKTTKSSKISSKAMKSNGRIKEITLTMKSFSKRNLLMFAILFSLIGILLLFLFSFFFSPKYTQIENLPQLKNGAYVTFSGYVKEIKEDRLTICNSLSSNSACATVVLRQGSFVNSNLLIGDFISVKGTLSFFNKKPYIYVSNLKEMEAID